MDTGEWTPGLGVDECWGPGLSVLRTLLLPPAGPARPCWALVPSSHLTFCSRNTDHSLLVPGVKAKKPIQTKFRMPLLNWVALKPNQITGTVFTELNDEKVLQVRMALLVARVGTREGGDLPDHAGR